LAGFANYFAEAHKGPYNEGYLNVEELLQDGILLLHATKNEDGDEEIGEVGVCAEYAEGFLFIRSGQLVEVGKGNTKKKVLHGVGRRIKLKPKWKDNKEWTPSLGTPVERSLDGFDEAWCLVNEGQWEADAAGKKDFLTGFGRSVRGDRR